MTTLMAVLTAIATIGSIFAGGLWLFKRYMKTPQQKEQELLAEQLEKKRRAEESGRPQ